MREAIAVGASKRHGCFFLAVNLQHIDVQNGQDGEACSLPEDVTSLVFIYEEPQVD